MVTYAKRSQDARLLETPGVTIQAHRQCMFYLFVLAMCFWLVTNDTEDISGNDTWPNITEIPLRHQAVTKIIATVTKQLASQIIEPIFLIYIDLRWLRDLHFRYRGLLLVSLGALGLTFGTTQGHQKDHLRPPWRTSENRHRKNTKKSLFWDLFWDPNWMIFLVFFYPCFTRVPSEGNEVQMSQNMKKKDAEIAFVDNKSQIEKLSFDCAGASGSRVKAPRNR